MLSCLFKAPSQYTDWSQKAIYYKIITVMTPEKKGITWPFITSRFTNTDDNTFALVNSIFCS